MHIANVKRVMYWSGYLIFLIILLLTFRSDRISLLLRLVLLLLMAAISSKYCLERRYGALSVILILLAATFSSVILAVSKLEFGLMFVLYIAAFFSSTYVWEKNLLGI